MANTEAPQTTPLFFTYRRPSSSDLLQGDLLAKTQEIQELIRPIHPYYLKDDYTHFIVLTQSCDLVRRKNQPCKARYITLAAVRPLDVVIQREIEKHQDPFHGAGMLCSIKFRWDLKKFLERLLNNEPEYFYLQPEPVLGFADPHCAFLRLSIPIKAAPHYDPCFRARILSLTDVFQAKLGRLVGNMYSRVGTEEWVPTVERERDFEERIFEMLDRACKWVDEKRLAKAKEQVPAGLIEAGPL
ncbi:MAG: hypothetical protein C4293_03515 [Nitrospiraceae bacterium]